MPRSSHLAAAIAAALSLTLTATASAAYAPKLDVKIEPTTPKSPPAVTSTITQASGETPSKTVKVSFPAGFGLPPEPVSVGQCTADQESQRACPDDSKIGAAHATASVLGLPVQLDGSVYFGVPTDERIKLIVFLDNAMLNQHVTAEGFVSIRAIDGGFDTTFDNLPDTLTTAFTLALDGAPHSLIVNPAKCGDFDFVGGFTSQKGEQAASSSTVTISGCPPVKLIMSPLDFEPVRPRSGRGTTLTFGLTEDATVTITTKRAGKRVSTQQVAAHTGDTVIKRFGRKLRAGRYAIKAVARTSDGRIAAHRATLVVRKRG